MSRLNESKMTVSGLRSSQPKSILKQKNPTSSLAYSRLKPIKYLNI